MSESVDLMLQGGYGWSGCGTPIASCHLGLENCQWQAERVAGSMGHIVQSFQVREAEGAGP